VSASASADETSVAAKKDAGGDKHRRHDEGTGKLAALLLSPTLIVLALVVVYPVISAFRESLFRAKEGINPQTGIKEEGDEFVGLDNYTAIFSGDTGEMFWNAFYNTTFFTVTCVLIETVLGVAMALVMHKAFRGRAIVRASILVPWAIPTVVSALVWRWIFDADRGAANAVLGTDIVWASEGWQAVLSVIIADTWKTAPFIGLLVLAGLQTIPAEVYEAAKVDGASPVQQFWRLTLPLVKPTLLVAVLFRLLDTLRMFDLPAVLLGLQYESVQTLSILAFNESKQTRFGPAAAYAVVLFIYVAVVAYMFVKLLGADVIGEAKQKKPTAGAKRRRRAAETAPEGVALGSAAGTGGNL
jgi:multiple sugar transport system permease protein